MLRAEQTPDNETLKNKADGYNLVDWYLDVQRKHRERLFAITPYVVADAWFSKANFVNELCAMGFHLISRLRDDASLWYPHDGIRTGKRGRPRIKGKRLTLTISISHVMNALIRMTERYMSSRYILKP